MKLQIKRAPIPNFGNVRFIAILAGEIVGNGDTKQAAAMDALTRLYQGYAMYHYGTDKPIGRNQQAEWLLRENRS